MSQYLMVVLFLLMPVEVIMVNTTDMEQLRQDIKQVEVETRAYRQRKSGAGL